MQPTDLLSQDHRVIERVLSSLEAAASRLQAGTPVPPAFFIDAADFIKGFADGCHHRKEEEHLFLAMEEAGFPRFGGPIGVMLAEHDEGRRYTAALRTAAERLAAGDASAASAVVENARGYAALLRQHIMKEDNVLFMMAKRALPPEKQEELLEAFERVEREDGNHDRWLALVDKLEREVGIAAPAQAHTHS
jgi:hemerythrin-like domain-containing protein